MSKESALAIATGAPAATPVSPPEAAPQVAAPSQIDSSRFAHLAKKEAELVKTRNEFNQERDKFNQERDTLTAAQKRITEFEELKQKDAVAAMKFAGFSDTDILNYFAATEDKSTPEEKAAKAAQAEIKKWQDGVDKEKKDAQEKLEASTLTQFRSDITQHVGTDKDKYEYINYHGPIAEDLIYETVAAVLNDSKELISIKEAADIVENYYEESDKAMSALKKRQPRQEQAPASKPVEQIKAEVSPGQPNSLRSRTLSGRAVATSNSALTNRQETRSEKRERLIQKLGNLGK